MNFSTKISIGICFMINIWDVENLFPIDIGWVVTSTDKSIFNLGIQVCVASCKFMDHFFFFCFNLDFAFEIKFACVDFFFKVSLGFHVGNLIHVVFSLNFF